MIALLEFYQPIFRETFGVELGRGTFDLGGRDEDDDRQTGFYFRRPRQTKAEAAAEAAVDKENSHEKDNHKIYY